MCGGRLACCWSSLPPSSAWCRLPTCRTEFELNDKVSHLVGHGSLALYFAGLVPRRGWWKIFVFLLLFGIAIEFAQYYMHAGRDGDPRDVIANSLGAAFGLLLARCGLARWPEFAAWLLGRRTTRMTPRGAAGSSGGQSDFLRDPHPDDGLRPLAERMRPRTLDEVVGQRHLLGPGKPLRRRSNAASCIR